MEKKCGFCEIDMTGEANNKKWCSPECSNRGNQLAYFQRLKQRAVENPEEFHGKYKRG